MPRFEIDDDRAHREPVPASVYDEPYFLEECEGYAEYQASEGRTLSPRLQAALDLAAIRSGERTIDLGCGRGELAIACADLGAIVWAIDYSSAALSIARRTLNTVETKVRRLPGLLCGEVSMLPFRDGSADVVFMLDLVEHLQPYELASALSEVHRVLRPGGRLIVHTMPNRWYYLYGYPIYRLYHRLRGRSLPANPRDRWRYVSRVHVNEQDIRSLSASLRAAGFSCKVWVTSVTGNPEEGRQMAAFRRALARVYPLSLVFCNDIFAVATRPHISGGVM